MDVFSGQGSASEGNVQCVPCGVKIERFTCWYAIESEDAISGCWVSAEGTATAFALAFIAPMDKCAFRAGTVSLCVARLLTSSEVAWILLMSVQKKYQVNQIGQHEQPEGGRGGSAMGRPNYQDLGTLMVTHHASLL